MKKRAGEMVKLDDDASALEQAMVKLLDVAVVLNGESVECKLCFQKDDRHAEGCPVPALEQWINPFEGWLEE